MSSGINIGNICIYLLNSLLLGKIFGFLYIHLKPVSDLNKIWHAHGLLASRVTSITELRVGVVSVAASYAAGSVFESNFVLICRRV
jgi:hypothetical protein